MTKKKSGHDPNPTYIQALRTFEKLMLDPLWSSVFGFYFVADMGSFSWTEKQLLRAGIIDINRARANVDSTALLDVTREAISLARTASDAVEKVAGPLVATAVGGPAAGVATFATGQLVDELAKRGQIGKGKK